MINQMWRHRRIWCGIRCRKMRYIQYEKISKQYKVKLWFQGNLRLLEDEAQLQYFHIFSHLIVSCQIFF